MAIPKWVVVILGIAFNTIGGMTAMGLFQTGSKGAVILAVLNLTVGNALIMFGVPILGGKVQPVGATTTLTLTSTEPPPTTPATPAPLPPADPKEGAK